jgi:hypothetical protein
VRLIDDHRIAPLGDLGFPRLCLRLLIGCGRLLCLGAGDVEEAAQDERELLQSRDDDLGAVDQRSGELLAVLVDCFDHALGMLDLVDRIFGSGKTNSISWLSHRLASLHDATDQKVFDCVVVITDRRVLDHRT